MDRDGEGGVGDGLPPVTPEQIADMANAVDAHIRKKFERGDGETIPYEEPPESMRGMKVEKVLLRDGVILHHDMQFTTWDAIRLLFGARFFMHVVISTENVVGRTHLSETHFYVGRLRWRTNSQNLGATDDNTSNERSSSSPV
jgi:hypothetical protein